MTIEGFRLTGDNAFMHGYFVYIITDRPRGVLYTGVTNDLPRRIGEHRTGEVRGFSKKYNLKQLVWFEAHDDINEAIGREKKIKKWHRAWKINMIEDMNPGWNDLWFEIIK